MGRLRIFFVGCCICGSACGDGKMVKAPGQGGGGARTKTSSLEVVTDQGDSERQSDATKNEKDEDDSRVVFEQVEAEITTEDNISVKTYGQVGQDGESGDEKNNDAKNPPPDPNKMPEVKTVEREAMIVTTERKQERDVLAFVKVSNEPNAPSETFRELLWPNNDGASAANDGICIKGAVTQIQFKIYSSNDGDMFPGSEEVGILETQSDSIVFGYEEDGCNDDLCQDDNIVRIRCPSGIKLIGSM